MMLNSHTVCVSAVVFTACLITSARSAAATASFQGLGDLAGGVFRSNASAVSGNGLVVVGSAESSTGTEAFYWSIADGMIGLGDLPGGSISSVANDVSADGSVIVGQGSRGSVAASQGEAFVWTASGGMVGLGDLPGGFESSAAHGVSADGSVVVGTGHTEVETEGFRWTASGGMVGIGVPDFPFLPDPVSFSNGVDTSADGSIIVGSCSRMPSDYGGGACLWTEQAGFDLLGSLPSNAHRPSSGSTAISADGSVVVGTSSSDGGGPPVGESFMWTHDDGLVGLGFLPGTTYGYANYAAAVSGDGSVIVGSSDTDSSHGQDAYLWTADDGMRVLEDILVNDLGLDLTGWVLTEATGISDDGLTIVGTGINPNGDTEAFIATLPEPGTTALLAIGAGVLLSSRRYM